ncbi:hypothetical protein BKA81DRAFT_359215, partial [Phyllosticta paracitricarpa]
MIGMLFDARVQEGPLELSHGGLDGDELTLEFFEFNEGCTAKEQEEFSSHQEDDKAICCKHTVRYIPTSLHQLNWASQKKKNICTALQLPQSHAFPIRLLSFISAITLTPSFPWQRASPTSPSPFPEPYVFTPPSFPSCCGADACLHCTTDPPAVPGWAAIPTRLF